jgi:polysaccharide pyruvyl transferase WcaK-like protein
MVGAANRLRRPVIAIRIGIGPFKRGISRVLARRIARQAAAISVRSEGDEQDSILAGIGVESGPDPAFDYLATRGDLSLLNQRRKQAVDALLEGTKGRLRIGINLRPIRHLWSVKGEAHSRQSQQQLLDRVAEALMRFAQQRPVSFVFFPMNPTQYGYSDLFAAYEMQGRLPKDLDFRVWEADPDVDDILYLLRQLDGVIAMRLHAAIFAISQNLPVIGIDYYPGQGGKVEQLFQDLGRAVDLRRMDRVDADWLIKGLERIHGRP